MKTIEEILQETKAIIAESDAIIEYRNISIIEIKKCIEETKKLLK